MTRNASTPVALLFCLIPAAPAVAGPAPGAPGEKAVWTEADKDGFGTSHTLDSRCGTRSTTAG